MKLDPKRAIFALSISLLAVTPDAMAQSVKPPSASTLPIRQGFYIKAPESCANAALGAEGVVFRGRVFDYPDGTVEIVRVSRRSSREYDLIERNKEDGVIYTHKTKVRIINPNSFTHTLAGLAEGTDTFRFCSVTPPKGWR